MKWRHSYNIRMASTLWRLKKRLTPMAWIQQGQTGYRSGDSDDVQQKQQQQQQQHQRTRREEDYLCRLLCSVEPTVLKPQGGARILYYLCLLILALRLSTLDPRQLFHVVPMVLSPGFVLRSALFYTSVVCLTIKWRKMDRHNGASWADESCRVAQVVGQCVHWFTVEFRLYRNVRPVEGSWCQTHRSSMIRRGWK